MLQFNTPKLKYFSYRHGQIAYRETGNGPTLFLLHGMNGNSKSWANLFYSLSSSYRVIAWDAPSFGCSDIFGDDIFDYRNAAKALLKDLKIEDAIIIGHSMGGIIAAQLAADDDISISGLVLSSSHLGFAYPKGEELIPRYANRLKFFSNNSAPKSYTLDRAKVSTPKGTSEDVIKFLANVAEDLREESILDGGRMSQETDNREICSKIKVPVLILSGAQDTIISTEMHNALVNAIPHAEQFIFSEAGHASYVEYPNLFQKHIEDLAKKVWKIKYFSPEPNYFSNIQKEQ